MKKIVIVLVLILVFCFDVEAKASHSFENDIENTDYLNNEHLFCNDGDIDIPSFSLLADIIEDCEAIQLTLNYDGNIVDEVAYTTTNCNISYVELKEECRIYEVLNQTLNQEFNIEFYVTYNDETIVNYLYGVNKDGYNYLSLNSMDCARDAYRYSVSEPTYEEEYDLESESNEYNETLSSSKLEPIYVKAKFTWRDSKGKSHPLQKVRVQFVEDDIFINEKIYEGLTDLNGEIGFYWQKKESLDEDYKFIVFPANDSYIVEKPSGRNYYFKSEKITNNFNDYSYEFDVEKNGDLAKAFEISQAIGTINRYAEEMSGEDIELVKVEYPSNEDGCCYQRWKKQVNISEKSKNSSNEYWAYNSWDVIMHEYGHHLQHEFEITDSPGGDHFSSQNDTITYANREESKNKTNVEIKEEGCKLAWGESWATFIGMAAQNYYKSDLVNIGGIGDYYYDSYNNSQYKIDLLSNSYYGEDCERAIINVLLNMYDSFELSESDYISLGDQKMWNLVINSKAKTFSDFIKYCYLNMTKTINEYNNPIMLGALLSNVNISKKIEFSSTSSELNWKYYKNIYSSNSTFQQFLDFYSYNRYEIVVWNEEFNVIDRKTTYETRYTFSYDELAIYKNEIGNEYYIGVYCYQDCSNGKSSFDTGGYLSNIIKLEEDFYDIYKQVNMSNDKIFYEDVNYLNSNQSVKYELVFGAQTTALLQTFSLSPSDPYLEIYDENNNLIYEIDDDDGSGLNSFIYMTFSPNKKYIVKTFFWNDFEGKLKFTITVTTDFYDTHSDLELIILNSTDDIYTTNIPEYMSNIYTMYTIEAGTYTIEATDNIYAFIISEDDITRACDVMKGDNASATNKVTLDFYSEKSKKYYLVVSSIDGKNVDFIISKR